MTSGLRNRARYNGCTLFPAPSRALLAFAAALLACTGSRARAAEGEPPLDQLIEINSEALIGAETSVKTDLGVVFDFKERKGLFNKVFQTRGGAKAFVSKLEEAKGTVPGQKLLDKAEDVFSVLCIDSGTARSKFELEGDWRIRFKAKIPSLVPAAALSLQMNADGKSYLQTNFFHDLIISDGGKKKQKVTPHKDLQGDPLSWFDKTAEKGVDIEIEMKEKKLSIFMSPPKREHAKGRGEGRRGRGGKGKDNEKEKDGDGPGRLEVISQEEIEKPVSGGIALSFQKLSFLLGDFKIEGKLSRSWAEEGIAKLRKEGKLKLKKEEKPAPAAVAAGDSKGKKGEKAGGKTSLEEPDPEAEDDL
jgi:hypothetical protein